MDQSIGIHLDQGADRPLYQQLFDQIVSRIRSGTFPAGHRLPPTRTLAREVGTHRNTVVRAYEDLEASGFVTSAVGRGTFVASLALERSRDGVAPAVRTGFPWRTVLSRTAESEPLERFERLARSSSTPDAINLARMQPPDELLPHDLLRRCVDHALRANGARLLGYSPAEGVPRLRELIAEDLARQGVPAAAEDVIVTTGSQQAIDLLARALVNPGDPFLVDEATYSGAINLFAAAGAHFVTVPSDDQGPDLRALARLTHSGAKGFYLMPNCSNPTGVRIPLARREALVAWSHEAGVPLIEDDFAADLGLDERPAPPALRTLDGDVVYVGSFSKRLIPALRIGFVVAPAALREKLIALRHTMDLGNSALLQHALAEFLERGYMRAHIGRLVSEYRRRRDALDGALRKHLPETMGWHKPDMGVTIWLPLPAGLSPDAVFDEALRQGVLVTPSTLYAVGSPRPGGLRLTYCLEPPARLKEGARRLSRALAVAEGRSRNEQDEAAPPMGLV